MFRRIIMADAAARREARRKRILENSESRLQRIASRNDSDDSEEKHSKLKRNAGFVEANAERFLAEETLIEEEAQSVLIEDIFPATTKNYPLNDCHSKVRSLATHLAPNNARERTLDKESAELNNERLSPEIQTDSTSLIANKRNCEKAPRLVASAASAFYSALASRWILVILAAFVNIMFLLKTEYLFGKTVLAPFFLLALGRLRASRQSKEAQDGSMLTAALILCNVRPELVYRLKWFTSFSTRFSADFAVYIFSFIIIYNAVTPFRYDSGMLNSSSAAAQVNRYSEDL